MGELLRAAKALTSLGLAPANEETTSKLATKHPKRSSELTGVRPSNNEGFILNKSTVYTKVCQHHRGSSSGPSGWQFEHLRLLMDNAGTAEDIYFAATCIAEGKLPKSASKLLS